MSTRKSSGSDRAGASRRVPREQRVSPVAVNRQWLVTDAWEPSLLRKLQQAEPRLRQRQS